MAETRFLRDYSPYPFRVRETRLDVTLAPQGTVVSSRIEFERTGAGPLVLDGGTGLRTRSVTIDGAPVDAAHLAMTGETLTVAEAALPDRLFTFAAQV